MLFYESVSAEVEDLVSARRHLDPRTQTWWLSRSAWDQRSAMGYTLLVDNVNYSSG
jgi:inhibitor of KinA sporulation pathway (predicted exonuclease)